MERRAPWKFTVGLPGSSGGSLGDAPMLTIAKDFGISDRGLAKFCARLEVPVRRAVEHRAAFRTPALGQRAIVVDIAQELVDLVTAHRPVLCLHAGIRNPVPRPPLHRLHDLASAWIMLAGFRYMDRSPCVSKS